MKGSATLSVLEGRLKCRHAGEQEFWTRPTVLFRLSVLAG